MRTLTNKILSLSFLIPLLFTSNVVAQTSYDEGLVSTDKELNFAFTDKRGIKAENGDIYFVDNGGQTLTAYNNENRIKWTAYILKSCPEPLVGRLEIRYINLTNDRIDVTFGKHDFASVDIVTGKVKCLGAD